LYHRLFSAPGFDIVYLWDPSETVSHRRGDLPSFIFVMGEFMVSPERLMGRRKFV
jgi:hypothetical protein